MTEMHRIFKVLSNQTRYRIFEMLLTRDFCVGGLARKLNVSEAAVSQHIDILKQATLIIGKKHGYFMHYEVNRAMLGILADKLCSLSKIERIELGECIPHNQELCPHCSSSNTHQLGPPH
ncbi:MAG: metalloregulator ArsR/SmtB family transcription factor [Sphaerochaetaceae bacterium]|nr:metalloregulator ArsR/SmtB family transcription factor [Sphaerochaetaceae bacterium]